MNKYTFKSTNGPYTGSLSKKHEVITVIILKFEGEKMLFQDVLD